MRCSRVPFSQPVPIGDMDRESLLSPEKSLCLRRVLIGTLQRSDGLALTSNAALRPLNAQFCVLKVLL